ncbi:hypothetical protein FRB98_004165 [Tulasnella sp. 332]|nr:hypothetical protein FRB98_004165 [Tulasnella sp. 332]
MAITQESSSPLVVVVGATGIQGGSVIKTLQESNKQYRIRGLTRDTKKDASKALTERGVEMVAVNLTVENKEAVYKAFEGATYAFAVTNFWEHFSKDREVSEGKMMVDAAKAANVKLLVWSGLPGYDEISGGKYKNVHFFDSKAIVTAYAKHVGLPFASVEAGVYMTNYVAVAPPKKQADGSYAIILPVAPDCVAPLIDTANDYGLFVREAIESPKGHQTEIFAYSEMLSYADVAKTLGDITGKKIVCLQVSPEQCMQGMVTEGLSESVALEYTQMFQVFEEFGYYGTRESAVSVKSLTKKPRTWAEFVKATDWSKVLA